MGGETTRRGAGDKDGANEAENRANEDNVDRTSRRRRRTGTIKMGRTRMGAMRLRIETI